MAVLGEERSGGEAGVGVSEVERLLSRAARESAVSGARVGGGCGDFVGEVALDLAPVGVAPVAVVVGGAALLVAPVPIDLGSYGFVDSVPFVPRALPGLPVAAVPLSAPCPPALLLKYPSAENLTSKSNPAKLYLHTL